MERHPLLPLSWGADKDEDADVGGALGAGTMDLKSMGTASVSLITIAAIAKAYQRYLKQRTHGRDVEDDEIDTNDTQGMDLSRLAVTSMKEKDPKEILPLVPFGSSPDSTPMPPKSSIEELGHASVKLTIGKGGLGVKSKYDCVYELSKRYWSLCRYPRDYTSESTEPGATAWATRVKINDDWSVQGDPSELEGILLLENMALEHLHKSGREDLGYTDSNGNKHTWYTRDKGFLEAKYVDEVLGFLTLYPIRHNLSGAGESHLCGMELSDKYVSMLRDTGKLLRLLPPSCQLNIVNTIQGNECPSVSILPQTQCEPRCIQVNGTSEEVASHIKAVAGNIGKAKMEEGKTYTTNRLGTYQEVKNQAPGYRHLAPTCEENIPASESTKYLIAKQKSLCDEEDEYMALYLVLGIHPLIALTDRDRADELLEYAKTVVFVEPEAKAAWSSLLVAAQNLLTRGPTVKRLNTLTSLAPPGPPQDVLPWHKRVGPWQSWWPLKCPDPVTEYLKGTTAVPMPPVAPPALSTVLK